MRHNDEVIDWANRDLDNAECRNRRNRHSPIRPRNLDADFVLNYNGQDVFATPSANLAAVFQMLEGLQETPEIVKTRARLHVATTQAHQLREDNLAYRAQSSHHSTRPHGDDGEVNQGDLRLQLNQQDMRQRINNRHHQRDAAEQERCRQYDEEHGDFDIDYQNRGRGGDNRPRRPRRDNDPGNDLDVFSAFSRRLRAIHWPATFKPTGIEKYDGESDPMTWLRTYSIAVPAALGDNNIMAVYFPVMMGPQALNWLEALPAGSINSWQDLCSTLIQYYQASCPGPKTRWDPASVVQQPNESLRDYIKRYFANRNTITEADDRDVIHYFNEGLHNIELCRKMF